MKIGIFVNNTRELGGQFQFLVMFLDAIANSEIAHEFYLFYINDEDRLSEKYRKESLKWIDIGSEVSAYRIRQKLKKNIIGLFGPLGGIIIKLAKRSFIRNYMEKHTLNIMRTCKEKFFFRYNIDVIFFLSWVDYCWECGIPFVFTVHDVQHRLQPEFPEVSLSGEWEWRERFFHGSLKKAKIVLVDSEEGKNNILQFYDCEQFHC